MKKILQKYILGISITVFALSISSVSAQQVTGMICTTSGGQNGTWNGSICIGNANNTVTNSSVNSNRAQANNVDLGVFANLIKQVQNLVGLLPPLAVAIAVVWFMFNIIKYFMINDDPAKKGDAVKNAAIGLVAIFIMVSIWGIVYFLNSSTGINQGGGANIPAVPTYNQ